jgi:hypothetical protein
MKRIGLVCRYSSLRENSVGEKKSRTEEFLGIRPGDVVTFVGGGGKSTLIHTIARRLAREDRTVVTTATRPFRPEAGDTPYVFLTDERPFGDLLPNLKEHGTVTVAPERRADGTLAGYSPEEVDTFADVGDYLFVEAQDSGGASLPAPTGERFAVPPLTTVLCAVAGLDALGPDLDCTAFADRLADPASFLFVWPQARQRVILLNKADRRSIRMDGARISKHLYELLGPPRPKILLTSVRDYLKPIT